MGKKRYTTDEIIKHLRTFEIERAKGRKIEEVARSIGVPPLTFAQIMDLSLLQESYWIGLKH